MLLDMQRVVHTEIQKCLSSSYHLLAIRDNLHKALLVADIKLRESLHVQRPDLQEVKSHKIPCPEVRW